MKSTLYMSTAHYDYLVIGGGSGGMASARRAAGYGAKVSKKLARSRSTPHYPSKFHVSGMKVVLNRTTFIVIMICVIYRWQ